MWGARGVDADIGAGEKKCSKKTGMGDDPRAGLYFPRRIYGLSLQYNPWYALAFHKSSKCTAVRTTGGSNKQ
jgi:hypothetical protein